MIFTSEFIPSSSQRNVPSIQRTRNTAQYSFSADTGYQAHTEL